MGRHIADHRTSSQGGRTAHFLAIAHSGAAVAAWRRVWQRATNQPEGNRRMVEFLRILRGRLV